MRSAVEEAQSLLDAIAAVPRGCGTPGEKSAREYCTAFLRGKGFSAHEEQFSYSAFAGTLAVPMAGAILLSLFVVSSWYGLRLGDETLPGEPEVLAAILVVQLLLLAAVGLLATHQAVLHLPLMRRSGFNLVAHVNSGGANAEPRLWLMAHLDSKSQPISILARAAGVTGCAVMLGSTALMLGAQGSLVALPRQLWYMSGALGILVSVPLLLSVVSNESRGALDNASGVVAVLMAAAALAREGISGVGVLITSAEELGLAGAHAWSAGRAPGFAINCDSVDDAGGFLCLGGAARGVGGLRVGLIREGEGAVAREIVAAARTSETPLFRHRRLMGILVDSMALEARGWDTVTVSKGTLRSLGRIHTASDTPANCRGLGSAAAAILIRDASSALLARV